MFFGLFMAMLYCRSGRISWPVAGKWHGCGWLFRVPLMPRTHAQPRGCTLIRRLLRRSLAAGSLLQGVFGLAYGGLFGRGWGQGPGANPRPVRHSDMIISSLVRSWPAGLGDPDDVHASSFARLPKGRWVLVMAFSGSFIGRRPVYGHGSAAVCGDRWRGLV